MKCLIPSQNVKILARSVNSLSKIGDDCFVEGSDDGVVLRTVNLAQSAFSEFRFYRSFFSSYFFDVDDESGTGVKVTMKSLLSVFKNPHCMDKQVESCEVKMRPAGDFVVFVIKYVNSYVRKYYLPIIENERLEANVPEGAPNGFTVSSKFLSSAVKNFRHSEDEVTLTVEKEKTFMKNHLELRRDEHFMRTELCFHPTEFENYSVSEPTSLTFCFKELRAVLAFAEPSGLPIISMFSTPGRPILFKVENHPGYEASYVVSTLNSTNAALESNLVSSQRSVSQRRVNRRDESTGNPRRDSGLLNYESEDVDNRIVQQMSMEVDEPNGLRAPAPNRSSELMKAPIVTDVEIRDAPRPSVSPVFPSRIEETRDTPDSSVHSSYGTNSDLFNNASPVSPTVSPGPSFPSIPHVDPSAQRLTNVVFARCFTGKNILDCLPEHKIVLAHDSDSEPL